MKRVAMKLTPMEESYVLVLQPKLQVERWRHRFLMNILKDLICHRVYT